MSVHLSIRNGCYEIPISFFVKIPYPTGILYATFLVRWSVDESTKDISMFLFKGFVIFFSFCYLFLLNQIDFKN